MNDYQLVEKKDTLALYNKYLPLLKKSAGRFHPQVRQQMDYEDIMSDYYIVLHTMLNNYLDIKKMRDNFCIYVPLKQYLQCYHRQVLRKVKLERKVVDEYILEKKYQDKKNPYIQLQELMSIQKGIQKHITRKSQIKISELFFNGYTKKEIIKETGYSGCFINDSIHRLRQVCEEEFENTVFLV